MSDLQRPARIISGAQTGADQAALRAGTALSIPVGGWVPRGYLTERGQERWLKTAYPTLREHSSSYMTPRTIANLMLADATILFGDLRSPGSRLTYKTCVGAGKPFQLNPTHVALAEWVDRLTDGYGRPIVLNVAGNRHSANVRLADYVFAVLVRAWDVDRRVATPVGQLPSLCDMHGVPARLPGDYRAQLDLRLGGEARA